MILFYNDYMNTIKMILVSDHIIGGTQELTNYLQYFFKAPH